MEENIALLSLKKVTREHRIINSRDLLSFDETISQSNEEDQVTKTDTKPSTTNKNQLSPQSSDSPATYEESKQELSDAIEGSNDLLAMAHTTLSLLRDTVSLDRAKLTVTRRNFVRSAEVMSIRVEDVMNVTASVGPLFGNLTVTSRIMNSGPFTIGPFWRKDAIKLKRIVQGYIIALQREIDCSTIPTYELKQMLDKIGEDEHQT